MRKDVRQFVRECRICQRMKSDSLSPAGLLQPLNILNQVFEDIALDFITSLPKSNGKEAILGVIKLHGIPKSMVSDRDRIFVSELWKEMLRLQGT
ncbi:hypothetical protein HRI_004088600 [Hibiscus trionum]|uniref:Integrase catalytic domain-containing protein n=1 Tax=Hibiscus trionum TaxID=183268 RepID=A0A9W7MJF1_HIBTR|nr:hypothetical protein HRI_004088600 [Hibiscus trionum]